MVPKDLKGYECSLAPTQEAGNSKSRSVRMDLPYMLEQVLER